MIELKADLWKTAWTVARPIGDGFQREVDKVAIVVTTNGFVKKNGEAVMGRGCAKEAQRYLSPTELGDAITRFGNRVFVWPNRVYNGHTDLVTFPVKHAWYERADTLLIERSVSDLLTIAAARRWEKVVMPRPGCGNGQLSWEGEPYDLHSTGVRGICSVLDDRFVVVDYPDVDL